MKLCLCAHTIVCGRVCVCVCVCVRGSVGAWVPLCLGSSPCACPSWRALAGWGQSVDGDGGGRVGHFRVVNSAFC